MLGIQGKHTEVPTESAPNHLAEGEGFLFMAVLAASWMIAIGLGWVVWRLAPF
jgi:hypothetical protein